MGRKKKPAAEQMEISLLGGIQIRWKGVVLRDQINRSLKLWSVLAYLIVHRDRDVLQSELIDLFWPDDNSANPANALKTLLHRIRTMLEEYFGEDFQPIASQRGSYAWRPEVECVTDVDRFERLCRQAATGAGSRRLERYREAVALYTNDFLPKLSGQLWVIQLSTHYHSLYLQAVKGFAARLEQAQLYEEMGEVCTRASRLDPLDEEVHTLVIRALLLQGKNAAALAHYETATDTLYRNLGVRPSEELRALYAQIMKSEKALETDLQVIQSDLREAALRPGAFYCEYGFFREVYRLEARRVARTGVSVHIGLLTVSTPGGEIPPLDVLGVTMDQLREVIVGSLRRGDVVAKYNGAQYVVMLPAANLEDSERVMNRIVTAFYRQHRKTFLKITARVRALENT